MQKPRTKNCSLGALLVENAVRAQLYQKADMGHSYGTAAMLPEDI